MLTNVNAVPGAASGPDASSARAFCAPGPRTRWPSWRWSGHYGEENHAPRLLRPRKRPWPRGFAEPSMHQYAHTRTAVPDGRRKAVTPQPVPEGVKMHGSVIHHRAQSHPFLPPATIQVVRATAVHPSLHSSAESCDANSSPSFPPPRPESSGASQTTPCRNVQHTCIPNREARTTIKSWLRSTPWRQETPRCRLGSQPSPR